MKKLLFMTFLMLGTLSFAGTGRVDKFKVIKSNTCAMIYTVVCYNGNSATFSAGSFIEAWAFGTRFCNM